MEWDNRKIGILVVIALVGVSLSVFLWIKYSKIKNMVGFGTYNFPCQYNATNRTLDDGQGSAINCDINGNIIITN